MPIGLQGAPDVDLDRLDQGAASLPISQGAAYGATFGAAFDPRPALSQLGSLGRGISDAYNDQAGEARVTPPQLSSEQANQQYGIDGYLRFNAPTYEDEAAFKYSAAKQQQFNQWLADRSNANPLINFGAGLAGGMVNPANLGLAALTGPVTEGLGEALNIGRAADAGVVASRVGRVANRVGGLAAEGAVAQIPFVGANYATARYMGQDYDAGDALRDMVIGATLHTGFHYMSRALGGARGPLGAGGDPDVVPGAAEGYAGPVTSPEGFAPPGGIPDAVQDLPPAARAGAFAKALDDMIDDRPVDVGQYVDRELTPPGLDRLDEVTADPELSSWRPLSEDTAITPRGSEVPVRYGLAELGDLVTSHDDNLQPNPAYPAELQPRDRARAGAQARNLQLEQELNPKLLMSDVSAAGGAPIVAPDGTVESGNGRSIALRRSADRGTPAYASYVAELKARGLPVDGMKQPVLVRMRTQALEGGQRAALAREMNADVTERMGGTEQAMVDAQRLDDASFDQVKPNEGPATSRDFARSFIAKVAPDQANVLANSDGTLSPEGARRIKAAVLARAYGDRALVGQVFEGEETATRQLGEALADAAPAWAKLRSAAARGEIPAELDLTPALKSAMDLVRYAKDQGEAVGRILAERLGQTDMFSGEAISPYTEAFLRLFYRDEAMTKPESPAKIAAALRYYVTEAMKVTPGPDLFGDTAGENTSRQILSLLADRYARGDAGNLDVRAPGRAADAGKPTDVVGLDVRPDGQPGAEPAGSGVSEQAGKSLEVANEPIKPGDLWRLNRDQLTDLLAEAKMSDHEKLVKAFGSEEQAKEFQRLDRKRNSSDPRRSDEGSREFDEKFGDLTPEQDRLVYGIGETDAQVEEIQQVLAAHEDVFEGDAEDWVSYTAARGARVLDADSLDRVMAGEATPAEQAAFVRMQSAYQELSRQGVSGNDIPRKMVEALVDRAGWRPEQAAEIIGRFVDDLQKIAEERRPKPDRPAIEAPKPKQIAGPKPPTAEQLIAADPELRDLAADTERLAAENGIEAPETPAAQEPKNLAEAIRAAAVCLIGELG